MFWISGAHRVHKAAQIIAWGAFQSGEMATAAHRLGVKLMHGQIDDLRGEAARRCPFPPKGGNHAVHTALFGMVINLTAAAQAISGVRPVAHISNQGPQADIGINHIFARQLGIGQGAIGFGQKRVNILLGHARRIGRIVKFRIGGRQKAHAHIGGYEDMFVIKRHGQRRAAR